MKLRNYQREAVDATYEYLSTSDGNPLVVIPTAGGKSFVMATIIQETLETWSDRRIIVVTHVKELIEQNYRELLDCWSIAPAGIYSAGLNRREPSAQVLFAGIQSIHRKANQIGERDLILVDEANLVPRKSSTMYRRFFDAMAEISPDIRIIGLTATHYRLDSGLLTGGNDRLFSDVAYDVPVTRLIEEGYLAPLVTKATKKTLDTQGVHKRGGDYILSELAEAVDDGSLNQKIVWEIIDKGRDRKSWLLFCSGVKHAHNVRDALRKANITAETITGETNTMDREFVLQAFKAGEIQALTNCDILTTGFNYPALDLIAFLRPTESTGLYVQMAGRGMRIAEGKSDCLVLDFAGNIFRHGPIDRVNITATREGSESQEPPVRECPNCHSIIFTGFRECPDCGYEFPAPEPDLVPLPDTSPIIGEADPEWFDVNEIVYSRHRKAGKPDSLKVTYHDSDVLGRGISEWICLFHGGYAAQKGVGWWYRRRGKQFETLNDVLNQVRSLVIPSRILVREDGKYNRIVAYDFSTAPREVEVSVDGIELEYEGEIDGYLDEDDLPF